jgi:hypothetical protein
MPAATRNKPTGPPRRLQGFYRDPTTGDRYRSVTTILSQGVPKESLIFWAANTVADCAMDNLPYLVKAMRKPETRAEALDWLKRAHTRKKDERADIGSAVHRLIEAHVLEQPIPEDLLNDPEMAPFLEQFERFVAEFDVVFEASEMVVANPDELYAGTLDFLLRSARIVRRMVAAGLLPADADEDKAIMGDTKTGGEQCPGDGLCVRTRPSEFAKTGCPHVLHSIKGVYPEAGLQMSAYRAARVGWLRDGTLVDMPPTHPVGVVLHLRPEGYLLHPVLCDDTVFDHFRYARRVAEWTTDTSKRVLHPPLTAEASA